MMFAAKNKNQNVSKKTWRDLRSLKPSSSDKRLDVVLGRTQPLKSRDI